MHNSCKCIFSLGVSTEPDDWNASQKALDGKHCYRFVLVCRLERLSNAIAKLRYLLEMNVSYKLCRSRWISSLSEVNLWGSHSTLGGGGGGVLCNLNKYYHWEVAVVGFCRVTNEEQSKICIIQQYLCTSSEEPFGMPYVKLGDMPAVFFPFVKLLLFRSLLWDCEDVISRQKCYEMNELQIE